MSPYVEQLRLCSMFSADQLRAASEDGIGFIAMTTPQQQAFAALLREARPDLPDDKLGDCLFRVRQDSEIKQGDKDDGGKPYRLQNDWLVFTYIFSPGDEKQYKMMMEFKRLPLEPATSEAK